MIIRQADPNNGRQKQLFLLDKGKEAVSKSNRIFDNINQLIGDIDPEFEKILDQKIKYLEQFLDQ